MRSLADHPTAPAGVVRVVYTDLDGTLLGPGGSLFAATDGGVTPRAADALAAMHEAGVEPVPMSGRTVAQVREVARLLGARDFVAEFGGVISYDHGQEVDRRGRRAAGEDPVAAMASTGAAGLLLDSFAGRLEPHAPWAFEGREATMLFRGLVDPAEARELLERSGYGWLDLHDNGVIPRRFPGLDVPEVHAYHLVPAGVDKASAVEAHMARRALRREQCVAVGDSPSDVAVAPHVGAVFVVANGAAAVEAAGPAPDNAYVTGGSRGDGFAEAVMALLR